jgi:hypothetical protein
MFAGTSVFFALMISSMFISRNKPDAFEAKWFMVLTWIGSLFMGWWGTFIMISIPIDLVHFVFSMFKDGEFFIGQRGYFIILLISLAATFIGFIEVLRGPKIVEVKIPVPGLPESLNDLKIVEGMRPEEVLTIIFSCKEALFKLLHPLVHQFFGFQDAYVEAVDLKNNRFFRAQIFRIFFRHIHQLNELL